jgi:glycosyltransferase involved in cell wall biosynthesis
MLPRIAHMREVSVVIPVYRAEATLPELVRQLVPALEAMTSKFEIIFIEDCGGDRSWNVIGELAAVERRIRGIRLNRNYGQHSALLCGIRAARYPILVTMDDDLQHPPSEIHALLAALEAGADVVYGAPRQEQHGLLRDVASRLTKFALSTAMSSRTARDVGAFRAFRTKLRDGFSDFRGPHVSIDVLLTWTTTNFTAVKVAHMPRAAGESGYTLGKLVAHAFNLITGFSTLPLQIASAVGFVFVVFGFAMLAYILGVYLVVGSVVPGFIFLASIIIIFSGAQLFALGIFGEYLARIHFRTMDRPAYVVREQIGAP